MDELERKLIANLQGYLRERQDFIASIPTMDPIWTAPFDIIGNIFEPILGNLLEKCPNLFLLFDNIVRSEDIRAGAIEFHVKIISNGDKVYKYISKFEIEKSEVKYIFEKENPPAMESEAKKSEAMESNYKAAIYLGTSGCQAFYSIIENILRNTTRHSSRQEIQKVVNYSKKIIDKQKPDNSLKPLVITIEFHIDDKENSHKEDYILVRIYDNMGGWTKNNDGIWVMKEKKENGEEDLKSAVLEENVDEKEARERLLKYIKIDENLSVEEKKAKIEKELNSKIFNRKFNPQCEEGRIIDETGKIIEGGWGLKEMRICASFLRGFKIENYEQPLPENEPPVITPYIQTTNENKIETHSLGYKFYLPKVKDLLIISKEMAEQFKDKISTLKTQGIYIESDINKITELQSKGKFTHEFVLIDVDEENNIDFIKDHILELPYKVFYLGNSCNKKINEVDKRAKNRFIEKTNIDIIKSKSYEEIVLEIKKKWIEYLISNEKLPKVGSKNLPKVGFYPHTKINEWKSEDIFCDAPKGQNGKLSDDFIKACEESVLLLHKFDHYNEVRNKGPLSVLPFTHAKYSPIREIKMKFQNFEGEENFHVLNSYYDAIEVGLTNIFIIDERVYDETKEEKKLFEKNMDFAKFWAVQNVIIGNLEKKEEKFVLTLKNTINKNLSEQCEEKEITIQKNSKGQSSQELGEFFPSNFKNKLHFMIIHQTIITKIGGKDMFEEFKNLLPDEFKPWYVVITSGRGHPPKNEMPSNAKFWDFSNLRKPLIEITDKFLLSKILSALKD